MARKTIEVVITTDGRDKGKRFLITELSADATEDWAMRALSAMAKSRNNLPDGVLNTGLAGLVAVGIHSFMASPYEDIKPLLVEMFGCIKIIEPALPNGRALMPEDIEEVLTRINLRTEALDLHTGFFKAALQSISAAGKTLIVKAETSSDTQTTATPSEP